MKGLKRFCGLVSVVLNSKAAFTRIRCGFQIKVSYKQFVNGGTFTLDGYACHDVANAGCM